jgi:hypothetical protein
MSEGGLHSVFFYTPQGKIRVNLPDDIAIGDIISGTLIATASGKNDKAQAKNLKSLKDYILEIDGQKTSAGENWGKWKMPDSKELLITLKNKKGKIVSQTQIPLLPEYPTQKPGEFTLPRMGQAGISLPVKGKFNGDFSDTDCRIGDRKLKLWAESPRKVIVESPMDPIGLMDIILKEGDVELEGEYRNIGLTLNAPKLKLKSGETTELTVTVKGLEGLDEQIPLNLENKTPKVVKMEGEQDTVIMIHPEEVKADGIYTYRTVVTGIMPGNFRITALIEIPEDTESYIIAYLSYEREMLIVHEKYVDRVAESLNVKILGPSQWQIPRATTGFITVAPQFVPEIVLAGTLPPVPGDRIEYVGASCDILIPMPVTLPKCEKTKEDGIWKKETRRAYNKCVRIKNSEKICVEEYKKVGFMELYSDNECKKFIGRKDLYEWVCDLPPIGDQNKNEKKDDK